MITIPKANWHLAIAEAVESAEPEETIQCNTSTEVELGKRAASRLRPGVEFDWRYDVDDLDD